MRKRVSIGTLVAVNFDTSIGYPLAEWTSWEPIATKSPKRWRWAFGDRLRRCHRSSVLEKVHGFSNQLRSQSV